jgi:hypothetical protein
MISTSAIFYRLRLKLNTFISKYLYFKNLPNPNTWSEWREIDDQFKTLAQDKYFGNFRRNVLLLETMEYKNFDAQFYSEKLNKMGIKEPKFGRPIKPLFLRNSLNSGHQYRHLSNFSNVTELDLLNFDRVIEFGGGYGCMRWLFSQLNHKGGYTIIDNSGVSTLQQRYLEASISTIDFLSTNWVKSINELETGLRKKDLFIALWSLSEVPTEIMLQVLNVLENSENRLLIAFQNDYNGRNNYEYFNKYFDGAARIPISYPEGNSHSTYIIR